MRLPTFRPATETAELPGIHLVFNYRLRIVLVYFDDPTIDDKAYAELEAHLKAQGYMLQPFAPRLVLPGIDHA